MKRTLIALALAVYIGGVSVETSIAADQPQTPPSDWAKWLVPNPETGSSGLSLMAMNRLVNCEAASGQPITCVQNTTDSEIVGITCGSYHIMGAGAEASSNNPRSIKPHSVSLINFNYAPYHCSSNPISFMTEDGDMLKAEGNVKNDITASTKVLISKK